MTIRSTYLEVFLRKGVLKIFSKFTGEHPCQIAISIKFLCNFIEIALRRGCAPVNLLNISRTPFPKTPLDGCFWNIVAVAISLFGSSRPEVFYKNSVLLKFAPEACNFIQKEAPTQNLENLEKFLRTLFFVEHLWWPLLFIFLIQIL